VSTSRRQRSKAWKTRSRDRRKCWLDWLFWPTRERVEEVGLDMRFLRYTTTVSTRDGHCRTRTLDRLRRLGWIWSYSHQKLPRHPVRRIASPYSPDYSELRSLLRPLQHMGRMPSSTLHHTFNQRKELLSPGAKSSSLRLPSRTPPNRTHRSNRWGHE
jgi:hypothetical protein